MRLPPLKRAESLEELEVLRRVLASPEGRALRRILVDLDPVAALRGLAGRQGQPLRAAAAAALAKRLCPSRSSKAAEAKGAGADGAEVEAVDEKTKRESDGGARSMASREAREANSYETRQQERGQTALRARA